jgi:3-oxoadipate enol-lactonase
VADGEFLVDAIEGAQLIELPAAHLSNVEASEAFTGEVLAFLMS